MLIQPKASRRQLLRAAAGLGAAGVAAPLALNFAAIGSAAAQSDPDYRALVHLTFGGGNDHLSTVVPYDPTSHKAYAAVRNGLTHPRETLLPVASTTGQGGRQVALHGNLAGLKGLYDSQRLAVLAGVGNLIVPVTKPQVKAGMTPLPAQLGSHYDQSLQVSLSKANGSQFGWGGLMGDLFAGGNTKALFTMVSVFGYSHFLTGRQTSFYTASEAGAPSSFLEPGTGLHAELTGSAGRTNLLEKAYAGVNEQSRDGAADLVRAILPDGTFSVAPGGGRNPLAQQLKTVARIAGAQKALGVKRQIFFVNLGGFDTHGGQAAQHDVLMTQLGEALVYFDTMLGTVNMRNNVTLFTTAEFGRNYIPNSDGTDHGWGSHHFILGGAVKGGNVYGSLPNMDVGGPDFEDGLMVPTTSIDQYGATLAKWMGVSTSDIDLIFPNLKNFSARDVGFI